MKYSTIAAVFLAVIAGESSPRANAQRKGKPEKKDDVVREIVVNPQPQPGGATVPERGPQVFELKLTPAAEPAPALKYRLFPSRIDLKPGNSVPYYYRAILYVAELHEKTRQKFYDLMEDMEDKAFSSYDTEKYRERYPAASLRSALDELATAVTREETNWEWQFNQLTGINPITFRLEEIQQSRELARILSVKMRLEAAEGDVDAALADAQTMFKLSRDVAAAPSLICDLVGVAISQIAAANLRDIIGQTDCPNLYWALATLPDPPIDMRDAMEQEAGLIGMMFPFLKDPERAEHSPSEWARLVRESFFTIEQVESGGKQSRAELDLAGAALMVRGYPIAKRSLIESGMDRAAVEKMSVGQVIAIDQSRVSKYIYDETFKWAYLPPLLGGDRFRNSDAKLREEGYLAHGGFREIIPMASLLLPAVRSVQVAQVRLSTVIRGLMVLEAIRMHMAENGGAFPESLEAITVVPVPDCPVTGKPFPYHVENGKAVLTIQMQPEYKHVWWELHLEKK